MAKMHASEVETDADLVRRLVRGRFPEWAALPVERVASGGTVNAVYRLGSALSVRLPLTAGGVRALSHETRWLPELAPSLPVAIPSVAGTGGPAEGFPFPWAVHRWLDGSPPTEGQAGVELARDLAGFVLALRKTGVPGGPAAYRGGPLASVDAGMRSAVDELRRTDEPFDTAAILASWDQSLRAPTWTGPPRWLHSDLMPSNLLVDAAGRLSGVLDFATCGIGDPACDLIPAWNLLPPGARPAFRDAVDADDATWLRGRGWALSMAVIQLPYYRTTNPIISANARYTIRSVLDA
ncbi:aminoglycoside phosphotransferase family protein [Actinomadura montaniterrae]|uniref:Aminoglycoside phosphotransferase family protein n=1 Tax=Actinomadura montaniterrae TaxID=1803903 RepID=A0A6L3VC81_9ACTN|nr:aminoglycoside phosphotransferase family protein [Actinomadura montaniterrae]KAB2354226.1 aminoglycoside phosphotransferase family protein [Actinomadura montaniterrae]